MQALYQIYASCFSSNDDQLNLNLHGFLKMGNFVISNTKIFI